MLSNLIKLQVEIEKKSYQFLCDSDSPLPHVKEAVFQLMKYCGNIEDQIKAQQVLQTQENQAKTESESPKVEAILEA